MRLLPRVLKFGGVWAVLCALLMICTAVFARLDGPREPSKEDKCPVCGMFVYKYPDWIAEIRFKDGTGAFFDGAKDLFKYYFRLKTYRPQMEKGDIESIWFTEYYDLKRIRAEDAFFVVGTDVYGPMGKELIPFSRTQDAETFKRDHGGSQILRFDQVSPSLIETLD